MDIASHILLAYAAGRAFGPRVTRGDMEGKTAGGSAIGGGGAEAGGSAQAGTVSAAGWGGFLSAWTVLWAVLPDADHAIEIFSEEKYLEWHRTFTHSVFLAIPLAILAAFLLARRTGGAGFLCLFLFALLGFSTHVGTDLLTTFGTRLLWPFREESFALDWLPPLDPTTLGILLAGVIAAFCFRARRVSFRVALGFFLVWFAANGVLHAEAGKWHRAPLPGMEGNVAGHFEVRDWVVPWKWHGLSIAKTEIRVPNPQPFPHKPGEMTVLSPPGECVIWEMNVFPGNFTDRMISHHIGIPLHSFPPGIRSPLPDFRPPAVKQFRFPAIFQRDWHDTKDYNGPTNCIIDYQYLSIWDTPWDILDNSPFLWRANLSKASIEDFQKKGLVPPGHLETRGRPLAVTLYFIVLVFSAVFAWGTWKARRSPGTGAARS